jgi:biopolymer transport protein ExbB/TolQ
MITQNLPVATSIEDVLFDVAEALRYPVLGLALVAAVVVLVEVGALLVELRRRRKRGLPRLERALDVVRGALGKGDQDTAIRAIRGAGFNRRMSDTLAAIVEQRGRPDAGDRIAKRMAEYDYQSMKRLERTRILVRAGPALGLMGTLIPLSPALEALAEGDVSRLTEELRVAFSVTVAGILIGMIAFAVSLIRDRLYAQDYSDVEYVAAAMERDIPVAPAAQTAPAAPGTAPAEPATQPTAVVPPAAAAPNGAAPTPPAAPPAPESS